MVSPQMNGIKFAVAGAPARPSSVGGFRMQGGVRSRRPHCTKRLLGQMFITLDLSLQNWTYP